MHMKGSKTILGALTLFAVGTLAAQTTTFNELADWKFPKKQVTQANGVITVTGRASLLSKAKFDVDPSKTYTLKAMAKSAGAESPTFFFGFNQYDKDGKPIYCFATSVVPGTDTELTAPAKKGDTGIKVKDGSKWKIGGARGFVYNSDPSYSDLPNRNLVRCPIKEAKKEGDTWTLTLAKPLTADLATGTKIRQHSEGGYMYTGKFGTLTGEWKTFTGSAKGILKSGFSNVKFAPGTVKAEIIMLVNWNQKGATEIKDISLDIK